MAEKEPAAVPPEEMARRKALAEEAIAKAGPTLGGFIGEPMEPLMSGSVSLDPVEHAAHFARGENHWFTCGLCDDGGPE